MDDLITFLRARLDEDEQDARAAGEGWYGYDPEQQIAFVPPEDARHIARHDPARVLRDVEAKRQIVDHVADELDATDTPWWYDDKLTPILKALALPYADHPEFQEGWRV